MEIYDGFTEKHIAVKTIQEFTGKDFQVWTHNLPNSTLYIYLTVRYLRLTTSGRSLSA